MMQDIENTMNLPSDSMPSPAPSTKNRIALTAIVLFSGVLGWILSGMIHESGHALVVVLLGGNIIEFQPFVLVSPPQIAYSGSFTSVEKALISLSGAGMVYLTGLLVLAFFPFQKTSARIRLAVTIGSVPFVAQSISFIILPILHLSGLSIHDDVISFITFSGWNPLWITSGACLLAFLAIHMIKRTRMISTIQAVANASFNSRSQK